MTYIDCSGQRCLQDYIGRRLQLSVVPEALAESGADSGAGTRGSPGFLFLQLSEQYLTSSKFFHFARSCMIRLQVTQNLKRFQTPDIIDTRRCRAGAADNIGNNKFIFLPLFELKPSRCRLTSVQDAGGIITTHQKGPQRLE